MDPIVERAIAKWPNVPHCYGWLSLDARGNWRMRNEQAQQQNLPGEKITQPALIGFIQRNYTHDDKGRWYFQNGPQRVYVDLEVTPYIVRTTPTGFMLQTDEAMQAITTAWLTENGRLLLQDKARIALLDDRDLAECLGMVHMKDQPATEEGLNEWIRCAEDGIAAPSSLTLKLNDSRIPFRFVWENDIATQFGFVSKPCIEK